MSVPDSLMADLKRTGQPHIAEHLAQLPDDEQTRLTRQLSGFDYDLVARLAGMARTATEAGKRDEFPPAPVTRADRPAAEIESARATGVDAIHDGAVAAFIVAGGQGTRLRYDGPKGCFQTGPVSRSSLFQIHAEKVRAMARRHGVTIPLYIMTSETNDTSVRAFFAASDYFGLDRADVQFCVQRMLPAFDCSGQFILTERDRIFCNPDGHGGSFFALESSGALADMKRRGVRHISYVQVDNPLVPVIDPLFIGEHVRTESQMSSKVLRKREPLEKLGVFGLIDGELQVVEYTEIPKELQEKPRPNGELLYEFGSIAIHVIDVDFAAAMAGADLPFHVAKKTIPYLADDGERVTPTAENGVKFERFVFDAIPHARNPLVMEVRREDEFAPVKNHPDKDKQDTPETARAAIVAQHRRWLAAAGIDVRENATVEISPLFALDAGEVTEKAAEIRIDGDAYLR
jgi:UDP-N-acetylglucosamine/UDP-N-acetylgalactosamine diphosphorylase